MEKHVSRAPGGSMCAKYALAKVKHAFFIEQKIIVEVSKAQTQRKLNKQKMKLFLGNKNKNLNYCVDCFLSVCF